jgi:hypothetical protein
MDLHLLNLHLSQANKSLQRAKNNNYSDQDKLQYQSSLELLFTKVEEAVNQQQQATPLFVLECKSVIDFIFKSLEFLENSTLNLIPYETVECLKLALYDWIKPSETYIIATSLINRVHGFSFDPALVGVDQQYAYFKKNYGVEFKSRLVQINIPRALARDYLASVAHYHELGHFVDKKYTVTSSLADSLIKTWHSGGFQPHVSSELLQYFPFLNSGSLTDENKKHILTLHLGEYFCDLFASQYIGDALNKYLSYISNGRKKFSPTHPIYDLRAQLVNDFLSNKQNIIVTLVNNALNGIVKKGLEIRFESLNPSDIYNFLPPVISNERQLHGLLPLAWDVWQGDWGPFMANMNMSSLPSKDRIYSVLNNLIEKAIGNYIVENKWKEAH